METVYAKKADCCGCGACKNICPKSAVTMQYDDEGFLYPVIDNSACIDCGKCRNICEFKSPKRFDRKYLPDTFLLQYPTREKSQSGGAFILLSDYVIEKGGSIYGCIMEEDNSVIHVRATTTVERDRMRGSKYVQSFTAEIYKGISEDLNSGLLVLFIGTPCQGASVSKYFAKHRNRGNLIVADFVCHGVPSPVVLQKYLIFLERKYTCRITNFICRDLSEVGWGGEHHESYLVNGVRHTDKIWRDIFYDNVAMRECCSHCPYTTLSKITDFTICDAWQIEKRNPEMCDTIGTSLVMLHSENAKKVFASVRDRGLYKKVHIDDYLQVNMFLPSKINKSLRKGFLSRVYHDFQAALDYYYGHAHYNTLDRLMSKIKVRLKKAYVRGLKREVEFFRRNKRQGWRYG